MSDPNTLVAGALQKVARIQITKTKAESMKPPNAKQVDGVDKFFLVYVANGREISQPCTHAVWKRALGPKAQPGRKLPGFDNMIKSEFFVVSKKVDGVDLVTGVDIFPKQRFERGMVPESIEGIRDLIIEISPTGDLNVKQLPPKVADSKLYGVMNALDKLEQVYPGLMVGGCEVTSVSGNAVHFQLVDE